MKKIRVEFCFLIISSLFIIGGLVFLYITLFKMYPGNPYIYASMFFSFGLLLFYSTYLQVRLENVVSRKHLFKIREHQAKPKTMVHSKSQQQLLRRLQKEGYELFRQTKRYYLFYRLNDDEIRKTRKRKLLEIIVLLENQTKEFYEIGLDEDIENIKQNAISQRHRVDSILITQFHYLETLDQNWKQKLEENIFIKNRFGVYSVINVALDESTSKAVFLHTKTYRPSLYYEHQIDEIYKLI